MQNKTKQKETLTNQRNKHKICSHFKYLESMHNGMEVGFERNREAGWGDSAISKYLSHKYKDLGSILQIPFHRLTVVLESGGGWAPEVHWPVGFVYWTSDGLYFNKQTNKYIKVLVGGV